MFDIKLDKTNADEIEEAYVYASNSILPASGSNAAVT